jgi:hypothetical protein
VLIGAAVVRVFSVGICGGCCSRAAAAVWPFALCLLCGQPPLRLWNVLQPDLLSPGRALWSWRTCLHVTYTPYMHALDM